jgi:osmotically-inducible protein OsmY
VKKLSSLSITLLAAALLSFSSPVTAEEADDSRIVTVARQTYIFRTYLQGDKIEIQSKGGAVILTGTVSENFHKLLAQETLAGIPGVTHLDNRLEVIGGSPSANSDAWLRDKVKLALSFHRTINSSTTEVHVKAGTVILRGTAESQAIKDLLSEYARDVEGITTVTNEMTVVSTREKAPRPGAEKIDDASVTAQVNMTLLNHRTTNVLNTIVKTRRGVVTVSGTTANAAEKKLVTRLVRDIDGVIAVKNRMKIK